MLAVQFVGVPCAFLFGWLGSRIGTKRAILVGLLIYVGISIYGYFVRTAVQFVTLGMMVALVQGGTQALSRSVFARMSSASSVSSEARTSAMADSISDFEASSTCSPRATGPPARPGCTRRPAGPRGWRS